MVDRYAKLTADLEQARVENEELREEIKRLERRVEVLDQAFDIACASLGRAFCVYLPRSRNPNAICTVDEFVQKKKYFRESILDQAGALVSRKRRTDHV